MPRKKIPQNNHTLVKFFPTVFGGIFVVAGLLFVYFLGIQTQLECHRGDGLNCSLQTSWMHLINMGEKKVDNLQKSWVDSHCDDTGCSYWIMLTSASGEDIHFDDSTSSDRDSQAGISNQINAGIQNLEKRAFTVGRQDGLWIILPLVFIAVGLAFAIGVPLIFSPKNMRVKE